MEETYHTFLVGDDATSFAVKAGFQTTSLSTARSAEIWADWMRSGQTPNFWKSDGCKDDADCANSEHEVVGHDTIGMVAMIGGEIACGTSTSGSTHKIPGRVGDSPIAGAGAYCENGVGGAAATGDGDQLMRLLPSFTAVNYMRMGMGPKEAMGPMGPMAMGPMVTHWSNIFHYF